MAGALNSSRSTRCDALHACAGIHVIVQTCAQHGDVSSQEILDAYAAANNSEEVVRAQIDYMERMKREHEQRLASATASRGQHGARTGVDGSSCI